MALQPSIILAGQSPDVIGSLSRGMATGQQANQIQQQNALANLYQTQGAGIAAGDQGALNALAGLDPMAALGVQSNRLGMDSQRLQMDATRQSMGLQAEAAKRAAAEYARGISAEQAAQESAKLEQGVAMALATRTPEEFDALMTAQGLTQLVGKFAEREVLAAQFMSVKEVLDMRAAPDPLKGAPSGYMFTDPANPAAGVAPLPGFERTPGVVVNTGDTGAPPPQIGGIPAGYQAVFDQASGGYRMEPIPGGPADNRAKTERTQTQGRLKLGTTLESLNLNIAEIEDGGLPVTGIVGDARRTVLGRAITGDSAMDFGNRTNQITDQAALAEVQNMRDNSPTGGAVGSLTDSERVAIGNSVTALNNSTSKEEYVRAAKAYRKLALDIAYGDGRWVLGEDGQPVVASSATPSATGPQTPPRAENASLPPSAPPPPSPEAVQLLRDNNTEDYRAFFDEIFGAGAAARVLGGR
jgi:hypothetical protein